MCILKSSIAVGILMPLILEWRNLYHMKKLCVSWQHLIITTEVFAEIANNFNVEELLDGGICFEYDYSSKWKLKIFLMSFFSFAISNIVKSSSSTASYGLVYQHANKELWNVSHLSKVLSYRWILAWKKERH